jgi:hypothetical protein
MVQIKTSSWFTKLSADHCRIGISRGMPYQLATFLAYRPLAPGRWFKSCATPADFKQRYFDEILASLDPKAVVADLAMMAEPPPPNEAWCHRALVSARYKQIIDRHSPSFRCLPTAIRLEKNCAVSNLSLTP